MNILLRTTSVGRRAFPITDADAKEKMDKGSIEFVRHKVYREITKNSAPPEPAKNPAPPVSEPDDDAAQEYQTRDLKPARKTKKTRKRPPAGAKQDAKPTENEEAGTTSPR